MKSTSRMKLRALTEGAVFVALAQILGYLKLFELPNGGSICLAMLPIFIYCARWGFGKGMLASFAFSVLQLLLDGAYAWGWQSMIGDYIVAFTVLGVAGLFHKQKAGFFIGTVVGSLARFLVAWYVGAVVWGEYMPDTFFGMTMTSPWFTLCSITAATWSSAWRCAWWWAPCCGSPWANTSGARTWPRAEIKTFC